MTYKPGAAVHFDTPELREQWWARCSDDALAAKMASQIGHLWCPLCGQPLTVRKRDQEQGMSCDRCKALLVLSWRGDDLSLRAAPFKSSLAGRPLIEFLPDEVHDGDD